MDYGGKFMNKDITNKANEVLSFLESVYIAKGEYTFSNGSSERQMDVIILNFVKVVDDLRAILTLIDNRFFIQSIIIARSTLDACNFLFEVCFQEEDTLLIQKWLTGKYIKHWTIIKRIDKGLKESNTDKHGIGIYKYQDIREKFDSFVHNHFSAIRYYPGLAKGNTPRDGSFDEYIHLLDWAINLFFVTSLLTSTLIAQQFTEQAHKYLKEMGYNNFA